MRNLRGFARLLIINATSAINKCHSTDCIERGGGRSFLRTWRLTVQGSARQDPARKAEGQRSLEICITCSNIKRLLVWPDNVAGRYAYRDVFLTVSYCFSFAFSLSLSFCPLVLFIHSGPTLFFLVSSISAAFLVRVLLSFSLNMSRIVASSKGCRTQKYLRTWDNVARKSIRERESY